MDLAYRNKLPDVGVGYSEHVPPSNHMESVVSDVIALSLGVDRLRHLVKLQDSRQHKDESRLEWKLGRHKLPPIKVMAKENIVQEKKSDYRLSAYRKDDIALPTLQVPPTVAKYRHRAKIIPVCSIPSPEAATTPKPQRNTNNQLLREAFIRQRNQTSPGYDESDVLKICEQYSILRYLNSNDDNGGTPMSQTASRSLRQPSRTSNYTAVETVPKRHERKEVAKQSDSLVWIPRLGAWISHYKKDTTEYFHFGQATRISKKHLHVCCRHHDFFHNNLNWDVRNWVPSVCPRFFLHHKKSERDDDQVITTVLKQPKAKRKPLTIPRDPFKSKGQRAIKRPWLRTPKKTTKTPHDQLSAKDASVTLILPNENDKKYQWMIDNATMTDDTLSEIVSIPCAPAVQSRSSTPSSQKNAVLVPRKLVTTVDRGCDPIEFSPYASRRESTYTDYTEYTETSEGHIAEIHDSSDFVEKPNNVEIVGKPSAYGPEANSNHSDNDVSPHDDQSSEAHCEESEIDENEIMLNAFDVKNTEQHPDRDADANSIKNSQKLSDDDSSLGGETSNDSYVAVIMSESESSVRSRASSPVPELQKVRSRPPQPRRRARPPVAVTLPKVDDKENESDSASSATTNSTTRKKPVIPLPTYIGRTGSGKSIKSTRSLIEVHTPSPTPSSASRKRRGKAVRDKAVLEELRRMKEAEERRKRVSERFENMKKMRNVPPPPNPGNTPVAYEDDDFLSKYCILKPKKLDLYRRAFTKVDRDEDGYLSCRESIKAVRKLFPNKKSIDDDLHYVFRILEMANYNVFVGTIDFHLFSIIVSLMQRISTLDNFTRGLLAEINLGKADMVMWKARNLFETHVDNSANNTISLDNLWIELHAGGISPNHEQQVRKAWKHLKCMDVLDFLTYLPLFALTHSTIVSNPLSSERTI